MTYVSPLGVLVFGTLPLRTQLSFCEKPVERLREGTPSAALAKLLLNSQPCEYTTLDVRPHHASDDSSPSQHLGL